jgi:UDPglucose 6-dehydrogenase
MNEPRVAIIGLGMVGGALNRFFETRGIVARLYDPPKGFDDPSVLNEADVIFIAVPTPFHLDDVGFDDSFLHAAIRTIPLEGKTIVLKSTILPGTTERFQKEYPQHRFLFNPEFLREATVDKDMQSPDRQIVGFTKESQEHAQMVMDLLPQAPFQKIVPAHVAEVTKYFGNAFLALKVAFVNQIFDLCQALEIPYELIAESAAADPRIGSSHMQIYHEGYRGYGGKCFPKDVRALIQLADSTSVDLSLLKAAETYNNALVEKQGIDIHWKVGSPRMEPPIQL